MKDSETLQEEQGWDIIIGNPPYIDYRKIDEKTKEKLALSSQAYNTSKTASLFAYFIESAAKNIHHKGYISFINPISYICADSGKGIRQFIDENLNLHSFIDVSHFKVFNASAYTCINTFVQFDCECKFAIANDSESLYKIPLKKMPKDKIENLVLSLDDIVAKISRSNHPKLVSFCKIFCALSIAGFRKDVTSVQSQMNVPFLESSDIFQYTFNDNKFLCNKTSYYTQDKISLFLDNELIFIARMTNQIRACIAPKGYFGGKVNVLCEFKVDKKYILGILNSGLINYFYPKKYFAAHMQGGAFGFDTMSVGSLPIPKITDSNRHLAEKITCLVEEILESKAKDSKADITHLQSQIDSFVYALYELDSKEIAIIESLKESK